ncbi:hypothetical protein E2C01_024336 [Portunus trituberculatus]|uniref:Uncharacterized protein n=1 Tax=Portunus trituberculatus TaxID=210409 RepID=A0A5B7ECJ8_PORTR|nr:hypothetical protein [Portunus trituberculatus]
MTTRQQTGRILEKRKYISCRPFFGSKFVTPSGPCHPLGRLHENTWVISGAVFSVSGNVWRELVLMAFQFLPSCSRSIVSLRASTTRLLFICLSEFTEYIRQDILHSVSSLFILPQQVQVSSHSPFQT